MCRLPPYHEIKSVHMLKAIDPRPLSQLCSLGYVAITYSFPVCTGGPREAHENREVALLLSRRRMFGCGVFDSFIERRYQV